MSMVQPVQFLADTYTTILSDSFALYGLRPSVSWSLESEPPAEGSPILWWAQPFDLGSGTEVLIGAPEAVWLEISRRADGGGEIVDSTDKDTARGAYLDFMRQTLEDLAEALGSMSNATVRCQPGREADEPSGLPLRLALEIRYKEQTIAPLWLACTSGFLSAMHRALTGAAATGLVRTPEAVPAPGGALNLDVLLDVELPVSVSFGKTSLLLKDVMKLAVGSIVELNRKPAEPVDVIVNNCIVARGEVVVVDGSYGLRLLEIIGQRERLSIR